MDKNQLRALFFVHDGAGLGHLHRISKIAKTLQGSLACLIVSGHRAASWIVSQTCEYIHLPSLDSLLPDKARHWGHKPFLHFSNPDQALDFRKGLLKQIINYYNPDAIFTDYLPLGKYEELADVISTHSSSKKYFIIRGILNDPVHIRRDILGTKEKEYLEKYYDKILVACDKKICDFARDYKLSKALEQKLTYVGYVTDVLSSQDIQETRKERGISLEKKWVVCSAGGGKDAEKLIHASIKIAKDFPHVFFDVIGGPKSNYEYNFKLTSYKDYENLRLYKETSALKYLHAAADIVICHGGYNSLIETLQGHANVICFPTQNKENSEQFIHSHRLSQFSNITPVTNFLELRKTFEAALQKSPSAYAFKAKTSLDLKGTENIKNFVYNDLNIS